MTSVWMRLSRERAARNAANRRHDLSPTTDATIWKLYFDRAKPTGKYYVYMLALVDGSRYIGQTHNVIARLLRHKNGKGALVIKRRGYSHLIDTWTFDTREQALAFEQLLSEENARFHTTYGGPYCSQDFFDRNSPDDRPGL